MSKCHSNMYYIGTLLVFVDNNHAIVLAITLCADAKHYSLFTRPLIAGTNPPCEKTSILCAVTNPPC